VVAELTADYAYSVRVEADGTWHLDWVTDAFSRLFGLSTDEALAEGSWDSLVHPDDTAILLSRKGALLSGQPDTSEDRLRTRNGEVRWVRDYGRPVWDDGQNRVIRIIEAGQDITERKRLAELLRKRELKEETIAANLRQFRKGLALSRAEFGQAFGGYSQRQINSYETGEVEVPLGLLLAIRGNGYPLEAVLGTGTKDALEGMLDSLFAGRSVRAMVRQLATAILQLCEHEEQATARILGQLGTRPEKRTARGGAKLTEFLRRAGLPIGTGHDRGE
jgi:PAS domain S-box-containing protein